MANQQTLIPSESTKTTSVYQMVLLGTAAGLAALLLLAANRFTAPTIALRYQEDQMAGLRQVMPDSRYENNLLASKQLVSVDGKEYTLFFAEDSQGAPSGYVVETSAEGYAGPIRLLIGVDQTGTILGLRVLQHAETPGLGDKIELAKSNWVISFNGYSIANTAPQDWAVAKDGGQFDQFSGATITPRAIVNSVHHVLANVLPTIMQESAS